MERHCFNIDFFSLIFRFWVKTVIFAINATLQCWETEKLTLEKAEEICRAAENRSRTNHQGAIAVSGKGPKRTAGNQAPTVPPQKNPSNVNFALEQICLGEKCPTWDQTCAISKCKNHFVVSQLCQIEKQTQEVHEKPHYEKNDPNLLLVN